jgi:hypothetical protein
MFFVILFTLFHAIFSPYFYHHTQLNFIIKTYCIQVSMEGSRSVNDNSPDLEEMDVDVPPAPLIDRLDILPNDAGESFHQRSIIVLASI